MEFVIFDNSLIQAPITVHSDERIVGRLSSSGNFARFYFAQLFPALDRIIYLDCDTIVQSDIVLLWEKTLLDGALLAAAPRDEPTFGGFFNSKVLDLYATRYGRNIDPSKPTFNAGVYIMDLNQWRSLSLIDEIHYWMKENSKQPLWDFGTQPLQLIVSYDNWVKIDRKWNILGLGYIDDIKSKVLNEGKLLHWNGIRKPWLENGLYRDYWDLYQLKECHGLGVCLPTGCNCQRERTGKYCEREK